MNVEYMRIVANAIRNEQFNLKLDMNEWCELPQLLQEEQERDEGAVPVDKFYDAATDKYHCGTSACIAGFTVAVFKPVMFRNRLSDYGGSIPGEALEILDLTPNEADHLFYATGIGMATLSENYKKAIPDALEWMADNNTVDWPNALVAVGAMSLVDFDYYNSFGRRDR